MRGSNSGAVSKIGSFNKIKSNHNHFIANANSVHRSHINMESTGVYKGQTKKDKSHLRGLGGVVVIDAAIGEYGRGSRLAHYFTVAATLDKSLTSHCL